MKKCSNLSSGILYIMLLILLFQDALINNFGIANNYDELLGILFIPMFFLYILTRGRNPLNSREIKMVLLVICIYIYGVSISYKFKDYREVKYAYISGFLFIKFIFVYFFARVAFKNVNISKMKYMENTLKIITVIIFSLIIINKILRIYPFYDIRYGIKSEQLFFSHPMSLVAFALQLLVLLSLGPYKRSKRKYIIMNLIIILFTLRSRGIVLVLIFLMIYYYKNCLKKGNNKLLIYIVILLIMPMALKIGIEGIKTYYFAYTSSPREMILKTGMDIAKDNFPFGYGFGTFGSFISAKYYSPVYYLYGLNNIYGLSEVKSSFIADCFIGMLFGELGVIGAILFFLYIFIFIINIYKICYLNKEYLMAFIPIIYLLISMTAEASFSHPFASGYFFIIALIVNQSINMIKDESKDKGREKNA